MDHPPSQPVVASQRFSNKYSSSRLCARLPLVTQDYACFTRKKSSPMLPNLQIANNKARHHPILAVTFVECNWLRRWALEYLLCRYYELYGKLWSYTKLSNFSMAQIANRQNIPHSPWTKYSMLKSIYGPNYSAKLLAKCKVTIVGTHTLGVH